MGANAVLGPLGLILFGMSRSSSRFRMATSSTPSQDSVNSFGGFTIFDFNRLRRASDDGGVLIATSIFLDIFNVFLLFLGLFGGGRR